MQLTFGGRRSRIYLSGTFDDNSLSMENIVFFSRKIAFVAPHSSCFDECEGFQSILGYKCTRSSLAAAQVAINILFVPFNNNLTYFHADMSKELLAKLWSV